MKRRTPAALAAAALAATAFTPTLGAGPTTDPAAPDGHVQEDFVLESHDGTEIHYTLFRPAGADAEHPVPLVFSSHGWAGSGTNNMDSWMDAGFGGLSFDQRGFGASGGQANVQDPELEGQDVKLLLDVVTGLDWVARDHDAAEVDNHWGLDDPTVFAVGGSYGGGYQTITALTEIADHGDTRFDALSPEITWYDLPESLGPDLVPRSAWLTALYAAGIGDVPEWIHRGYATGASTGLFPDGTVPEPVAPNLVEIMNAHSPQGFVEGGTYVPDGGVRINVPTLWRQGSSDTLFNLNQGIQNLEQVDPSVADQSYLIGYNGGHVLPTALPMGSAAGSDSCSGDAATGFSGWGELQREFFRRVARGESTAGILPARYGIADMEGACVWTDDVRSTTAFERVGFDGAGVVSGTVTVTGGGAPQYLPVFTAEETTVITGVPRVTADWYSASADQRVFFGLAKGTDEAAAATGGLMQHQMMPHRELLPSTGHGVEVELGGGGMTVEAGETVYLVVSPFVELFFGHGSGRTPGAVALEGITVHLPVQ